MDESTPESLLEDGETAAALATILARAEETDGTVTWAEVRADVDAEVWGKLLADDALVDAGEAFVVADPPRAAWHSKPTVTR